MKKDKRIQDILFIDDTNIALKIARVYFKNDDIAIRLIGNGTNNMNFLATAPQGKIVVKLSFASKEHRALDDYKKEEWCIQKAQSVHVPVPKVLDLGVFEGRAYMIMSLVPGIDGNKIENHISIYHKVGGYLKRIHQISVKNFGDTLINYEKDEFRDSWKKYLTYNISSLNLDDELLSRQIISAQESQAIREIFIRLQEKKFIFGLSHGDSTLENVLVDGDSVHLIDWGTAEAHVVPHFDIIRLLRQQDEEGIPNDEEFYAFLSGLGITEKEYHDSLEREIHEIRLLISIDKLRWAVDKSPDNVDYYTNRFEKILKRV